MFAVWLVALICDRFVDRLPNLIGYFHRLINTPVNCYVLDCLIPLAARFDDSLLGSCQDNLPPDKGRNATDSAGFRE